MSLGMPLAPAANHTVLAKKHPKISFKVLARCSACPTDAISTYKEILQVYWETATGFVNACCDGLEPWQLVGLTCSSTLLAVWLHGFLFQPESLTSRIKKQFFKLLRRMPFVGAIIQKKIDEALNDVTSSLSFLKDEKAYIKALPEQGMSQPEVLQKMKEYSSKGMAQSVP
ncbi:sphingosine-1-phosphate lyase 1-like isoform X1 [Oxyura jamaicensis]|uniref:sphingosine-1-phosphate lyase 1-like isoform X1 n=1 Tax=Oxyura jamaicensis TaxID=8884 RepID=UPI0015A54D5E|nr:sphingosine-1-phosphate lyase 1-like isoform X1 [Oxyura jamaicensis]XP_035167801.1 sphingosine-1-phosphate lyase 1-like isoform X1 [Oxyura jamaicensis]